MAMYVNRAKFEASLEKHVLKPHRKWKKKLQAKRAKAVKKPPAKKRRTQ